jgi:hypothetical protein
MLRLISSAALAGSAAFRSRRGLGDLDLTLAIGSRQLLGLCGGGFGRWGGGLARLLLELRADLFGDIAAAVLTYLRQVVGLVGRGVSRLGTRVMSSVGCLVLGLRLLGR